MKYCPRAPVTTERLTFVAGFLAVTAAPGRAPPCSSVTLPRSAVVTFWAAAGRAARTTPRARVESRARSRPRQGRDATRMGDLLRTRLRRRMHHVLRVVKTLSSDVAKGAPPRGSGGQTAGSRRGSAAPGLALEQVEGPFLAGDDRGRGVALGEEGLGQPAQLEPGPQGAL